MSFVVLINDVLENEVLTQSLNNSTESVFYYNHADNLLNHLQQQGSSLIILDDCLPAKKMLSLINTIRERVSSPILLLSELSHQESAVNALQAGADLYLFKPFSSKTLLVHIEALLRRISLEKKRLSFHSSGLSFSSVISRLPLTHTETELIQYLSKRDGDIVSKATLQKTVLKKELSAFDRNLDVHISNIRRKMSNAGLSKSHIKTVHGKGYTFCEQLKNFSIITSCFL